MYHTVIMNEDIRMQLGLEITEYNSTLYIGRDEVLAHYLHSKIQNYTFNDNSLLTPQDDS